MDTARLKAQVPHDVIQLCTRLKSGGFRCWAVGGCVRDILLQELRPKSASTHNDWDLATDARPEQVQKLFRRVIPTGIQHGTVTVLIGKQGYEVTTLRGESHYSDGRRPDAVHFIDDITADLARRDFTVNALAYDVLEDRLIDPFNGLADLEAGRLRAVGRAIDRFTEDGLRVLRAARFVATLEMDLEAETAQAIRPSLDSYRRVSPERIRDEWQKSLRANQPSRAFRVMLEHGLLAITAPELAQCAGLTQEPFHGYDAWEHALRSMDACPTRPLLRLSALLHVIGKPPTADSGFVNHAQVGSQLARDLLERLRYSKAEIERVTALVLHHPLRYESSWTDANVRRWLLEVTPALLPDLFALMKANLETRGQDASKALERLAELEARSEHLLKSGFPLSLGELAVSGRDLMQELGLPAGPKLGITLRKLFELCVDDPSLNVRQPLLEHARKLTSEADNG